MRLQLEATPAELHEKGEALLGELAKAFSGIDSDLAEALEKALPAKEQELKYPALRGMKKIADDEYERTLKKMLAAIGKILDQSVSAPSVSLTKAFGMDPPEKEEPELGTEGEAEEELEPGDYDPKADEIVPEPEEDEDEEEKSLEKAGPFMGPRGGKWADAQHTIPWKEQGFKHRSEGAAVGEKITVAGIGKFVTEPTDGDDSFPLAVRSFKEVGGWVVYEGKNGSQGVVVGTKEDLNTWKAAVTSQKAEAPQKDWDSSDGGAANIEAAKEAAHKVSSAFGLKQKLKFVTQEGKSTQGEHGGDAIILNGHLGGKEKYSGAFEGIEVPQGAHTAAHEMAHAAFSSNPESGAKAMSAVAAHANDHGPVTAYHGFSDSHFEGLMEAAALYANAPEEMKKKAPELYEAIREWFEQNRIEKSLQSEPVQDFTKPIADQDERAYERMKSVLKNKGYNASDFEEGGPLYGYSVNELIELVRGKKAS